MRYVYNQTSAGAEECDPVFECFARILEENEGGAASNDVELFAFQSIQRVKFCNRMRVEGDVFDSMACKCRGSLTACTNSIHE